ncbi:MAG: DUF2853 family protein [Bacteroidota bacterium]
MATLDDAVGAALSALTKSGVDAPDTDLLRAVTKAIGPAVYSDDAKNVACSDPKELERIADGFLTKKLGISEGGESVKAVCEQMKGAGAHKHRGAFYYLLVKHHGKESVYA